MSLDSVQFCQRVGAYHRRNGGKQVPSHEAKMAARFPLQPALRLHNTSNMVTALLPLSAALLGAGPGERHPARLADPQPWPTPMPQPAVHPAPRHVASAGHGDVTTTLLPASVSAIGNGVLATCLAQPRMCGVALATGTLGMLGVGVGSRMLSGSRPVHAPAHAGPSVSELEGLVPTPTVQDGLDTATLEMTAPETQEASPRSLQDALIDIARTCGGDRACRATAINALLQRLPPGDLRQLQAMVDATAPQSASSWPPGAQAAPLLEGAALETLVDALSSLYTPSVAHYQDDLEQIVHGGGRGDVHSPAGRREAIERLFVQSGHTPTRLPFTAADRLDPTRTHEGTNLQLTLRAPGSEATPPARHLMLVAHGDVRGATLGSDGAYDNASGVASLLHVLRGLPAHALPADTAVSLLVTDLEELHLLGSEHFAAECTRKHDCPTLVINVDLVGRGGHGFVLSSTPELADHFYIGRPPMNLAPPTFGDVEAAAADRLLATFRMRGFQRHPPQGGVLLTSDNLAFSNVSIPTLGVAQMSAQDAQAMGAIEDARVAYRRSLQAIDWQRYARHRKGIEPLPPEELRRDEAAIAASDRAGEAFLEARTRWPHSAGHLIHTGRDRLSRVNPRMAVAFSDALLETVRGWIADPTTPQ